MCNSYSAFLLFLKDLSIMSLPTLYCTILHCVVLFCVVLYPSVNHVFVIFIKQKILTPGNSIQFSSIRSFVPEKKWIDILLSKTLSFSLFFYTALTCDSSFSISTFCCFTPSMAEVAFSVIWTLFVSFSRACRSSSVRVLERTGRKGAGEPAREVRNCCTEK